MTTYQTGSFAQQLRAYRRARGLTQEELAERAGLSARGIRALEQGERSSPQRDTVRLLADALKLEADEGAAFAEAASQSAPLPGAAGATEVLPSGGFLGALPAGPLIGRASEVDRLQAVIADAVRGIGQVVMLAGEPGIGKTRLAQEVTLLLRERGALVATGQCYEPEQSVPYYPFLDALTTASQAAPAVLQAEIPRRWPHLQHLLPGQAVGQRSGEIVSHDSQQALFWSVGGFLRALAAVTPVAILLDDLHWVDESTLKLFQHLARHLHADRVLLLGTYRDVDVRLQHPLERTLRDLQRDGLLEEVVLRRLDREGTAAVVGATLGEADVPEEFTSLLHRHTDGNPFFTQEVVRALVERGNVQLQDGRWNHRAVEDIEIPRSIRSAVGERLSRLGEEPRGILHEASVLGQAFAFTDLHRMGPHGEDHLEAALDAAAAAGLVREMGTDGYAFGHALVQQVLYEELSARARRRLHRAAGAALERLPEADRQQRAAELAWHFEQADEPEQALAYSLQAGDGAEAVFAHAEAERHYRTARELARDLNDTGHEAEALQKLGVVLRMLARYTEALDALEQAAALFARAGNRESEARAVHEVAFVHYFRGAADQGIARLETVIGHPDELHESAVSSSATAELYAALAFCLWSSARYTEVLEATERAEEMAGGVPATRARGIAQCLHGMALTMIGPLPDAHHMLDNAIASLQTGDPWWPAQPWGSKGRAYVDEGDFDAGLRCLERSRALIDAAHDPAEMGWILGCMGELWYLRGDWEQARSAYERAIETARGATCDRYISYTLLHLADLYASEGNWQQAKSPADEGLDIASRCHAVSGLRKGQRLLAERDLAEGRPQSAIDRLTPLLDQSIGDWPRAFPPPVLAEAYLEIGDVARAEELVRQRVQQFRAQGHRRALALWLRVDGMVLARWDRWNEAERAFIEAVSLAHDMPYPHAEGQSLYTHGRLLLERGEIARAQRQLEDALALFRRLGARNDIVRTEAALQRNG